MEKPSNDDRQIVKTLSANFGGKFKVQQHLDDNDRSEIEILTVQDQPEAGFVSIGTVGLSAYALPDNVLDPPLGTEILAVSDHEDFPSVIATAALCVINSGWVAEPDRVFPDVVVAHIDDTTTPHLLFVDPYLWDDEAFQSQTMETRTVAWVQGIPITDGEMEYVRQHGADALGNLFVDAQPDLFDLYRDSIV